MARRKRVHVKVGGVASSQPAVMQVRNPRYVPPTGDHSPIEKLPSEVLAYIFELGTLGEEHAEDWDVEEDDGDEEYEDVDEEEGDEEEEEEEEKGEDIDIKMPGTYVQGKPKAVNGEGDAGAFDTEKSRYLPFPVRMSHVCHHWREIAINTPVLWRTLNFVEGRPFAKSKEWIARSKQCPLDLLLDASVPDPDEDESNSSYGDLEDVQNSAAIKALENLTCILDLIIPHVSRWRTFDLTVSIYEHMYYVLKRLEECPGVPGAPMLQSLRLYCNEDHDELAENMPMNEFERRISPFGGHVPKLLDLELWGVHLDWKMFIPPSERSAASLSAVPAVTSNLVELELAYHTETVRPSYDDFVNIIRCAPNLSSLKITSSGPAARRQGSPAQALFLPNLRHLTLGFFDEAYAISLLRLLYAPNLTSLAFDFDEGDYTHFVNEVASDMPLPDSLSANASIPACYFNTQYVYGQRLSKVIDVKLGGLPCAPKSAYTFYSLCDRLKRLYLNMHFLPDTFFSVLIQEDNAGHYDPGGLAVRAIPSGASRRGRGSTPKEPVVCKQLETLTVSGISGDDYVRFVKRRRALGAPIKELYIDKQDDVSDWDMAWLEKNVKAVKRVYISDDEDVYFLDTDVESEDEEQEWEWDPEDDVGFENEEDEEDERGNGDEEVAEVDGHGDGDEEWEDADTDLEIEWD